MYSSPIAGTVLARKAGFKKKNNTVSKDLRGNDTLLNKFKKMV